MRKKSPTAQITGRTGWDRYFINIAKVVATRSTCNRRNVGAVIVKDRRILATGYNGSIAGLPHCDEIGHMMEAGHCVATVHAEANAIIQAAKQGIAIDGATIYVTSSPCWNCFKMLMNAGISKIIYSQIYEQDRVRVFETASRLGVVLACIDDIDKNL